MSTQSGTRRLGDGDAGIIFGLDRADRDAVGIAGADAAVLIGLRIAGGGRAGHRPFDVFEAEAGDFQIRHRRFDTHVDLRQRNLRHRIGIARAETDAQIALVAGVGGHADLLLGIAVPFSRWSYLIGQSTKRLNRVFISKSLGTKRRLVPSGASSAAVDAFIGAAEASGPFWTDRPAWDHQSPNFPLAPG